MPPLKRSHAPMGMTPWVDEDRWILKSENLVLRVFRVERALKPSLIWSDDFPGRPGCKYACQAAQGIHLDSAQALTTIFKSTSPLATFAFQSGGMRVTDMEVLVTYERRESHALAWLSPASAHRKAAVASGRRLPVCRLRHRCGGLSHTLLCCQST